MGHFQSVRKCDLMCVWPKIAKWAFGKETRMMSSLAIQMLTSLFALAICGFVNFHFVHFDFHIGHTTLSSNLKNKWRIVHSPSCLIPLNINQSNWRSKGERWCCHLQFSWCAVHSLSTGVLEDTAAVCVAKMVNNASTDTPLLPLPPWHQIVKIPRKKLSTLSDRLGHKSNFWLTPHPVKWGRTSKTKSKVGGTSQYPRGKKWLT